MSHWLVILVGPSGVGKTTIREPLARRFGMFAVGPDDFPNRWDSVYWHLDARPCVLECVKIPHAVVERLEDDRASIVELYAPMDVCYRRLKQQGMNPLLAAQRSFQADQGIDYKNEVRPDLRVDATASPESIVDEIYEAIR